ncbi:HNH endonuclease [Phenylobacterium sp. LjRoot164]|uniref:HNH endonuclease signature motif containing protein n=1 Tax=unclassified Phenylobacterium TaxID=2640670 RepID=UPI003ECD0D41
MKTALALKIANIARPFVEATQRKGFTKAQRRGVWTAYDGCCAGCDEPLVPGWAIDHRIPLELGGLHEPSNWQALCTDCHKGKTREDIRQIAKARRIRKRASEGAAPSRLRSGRALQSAGFDKSKSKKFNGAIVPRKEKAA